MILVILTILFVLAALLGKHVYKKWFNPITIYTFTWYFMLSLYEIRLMHFVDIKSIAWFAIAGSFLSFLFGSLTIYMARRALGKNEAGFIQKANEKMLLADSGKVLNISILILSLVGIFSTLQHWAVLINKFGSIPAVIINANLAYRMRVEGSLAGEMIPYAFITLYAGLFLSIVSIALRNKVTVITVLPFIGIILKEIASSSRSGLLFMLFTSIACYFLTKNFTSNRSNNRKKQKIVFGISVVLFVGLLISVAGLVRTSRQAMENFHASSKELNKFKSGFFFTPSLYLYMCSHVGVFSEYLSRDYEYSAMWGETTFLPVYSLLSKFEIVNHPEFYEKGYYIPMWTNTATYLRTMHADFGPASLFWFPFLLGLSTSFFWYKYYETRKTLYLLLTTYLFLMIMFSFLIMVSRMAVWLLSLVMLLIIIPIIEKMVIKRSVSGNNLLFIKENIA